jgi:hypothetical protein
MAKQIQIRLMVAVDAAGEWAVVPVRDQSRTEAAEEAVMELGSDNYTEVFEFLVPVPLPKRPVRTVRIPPEALAMVAAEENVEDEELETVEAAG